MSNEYGLVFAHQLDGQGGSSPLTLDQIQHWDKKQGVLWLHFDYTDPESELWLIEDSGLEPVIAEALVVEESRPRTSLIKDGLLMSIRGIRHNTINQTYDTISVRMWIDKNRIFTTRKDNLAATIDINQQLQTKQGPTNSGDYLIALLMLIIDGMVETILSFENNINDYEQAVIEGNTENLRYDIANLRRQVIKLRRYLAPQRDALIRLSIDNLSWLSVTHRLQLHEINDRLIRYIENLDAIGDRAMVTQEELQNRLSEQLNSRMYVISVFTAIFLPLTFLTGLLGINVGGIPGASDSHAFSYVSVLLTVVVAVLILLFRWKKWF